VAIAAIVVIAGGTVLWHSRAVRDDAQSTQQGAPPAIPATSGQATGQDVPIFVCGLGTVQALMSVAIRTRVDGQITGVFFKEGRDVKKNDILFQIDPRPYRAALEQAQAAKQRDEAQLRAAQLVLDRYAKLLASATQTQEAYDNQQATVGQLQGTVKAD
jgi:multidrug efflux system membrane fusion protein